MNLPTTQATIEGLALSGVASSAPVLAHSPVPVAPLPETLQTGLMLAMGVLALGLAMPLYRLVRGPTLPDRVIALDAMANFVCALIVLYAVLSQRVLLVSVSLVIGLVLFLATVCFARYVERRAQAAAAEGRARREARAPAPPGARDMGGPP
jgi:multicomponent Na+:H+ antiporter subunit F